MQNNVVSLSKAASDAKQKAVLSASSLAPELPVRLGSTPRTSFRGHADIFGRLVEDHDKHRALIAMIGETSGASEQRKKLFKELVRDIKAHAAAEEQALWSTVMRNPTTTDQARHAVSEHQELEDMLADLAARDMASSGWLRRFNQMKEEYLHHIKEEEQEQFLAAQKNLTDSEVSEILRLFRVRKQIEKAAAEVEKKIKIKNLSVNN